MLQKGLIRHYCLVTLIWKTIFTPVGSTGGSSEMPLMIKFDLKHGGAESLNYFFYFPYFTTSGQLLNLLLFMLSIMEMYIMRTYAKHTTGYKMVLIVIISKSIMVST